LLEILVSSWRFLNVSDLLHDLVIESLYRSSLHVVFKSKFSNSLFWIIIFIDLQQSTFFPVELNVQSHDSWLLCVDWRLLQRRVLQMRALVEQMRLVRFTPNILVRVVERRSHRQVLLSPLCLWPKLLIIELKRTN